jgi:hypothetical protein
MAYNIGQSIRVLLDGARFTGSARGYNRKADWINLCDYLADSAENRIPIEMVGYIGLPSETTDGFKQRMNKMNLINRLRSNGVLVVLRKDRPSGPGRYTANVEVTMGIDVLDLARTVNPEPEHRGVGHW